ncbi:hypothetical protein N0V84_006953 [Fusarium piperis]|uniref:Restriction of telomere capping protein 4 n=1 Tax=Fusarium piperis TaxID=1435070 RepID=A0A9W8WAX8_9HYPO|nr:hypothetical protein N0V84_006953 [Fusarium piperis]
MLGLSRTQRPKPLLRQIGGKIRSSPEPETSEDVSAPPLPSDDEYDIPEAASLKLMSNATSRQSPAEDSEPDEPARGDIKRIRFPKGPAKVSKNSIRDADESGLWSSPEKSSKAKFKALPDDALSSPKKLNKAKLKIVPGDSFDTPKQEKKTKPISKDESSPSPTKGGVLRLSQNDDLSQRPSSSQQSKLLWNRNAINKARKKTKPPPKIERAQFIVPLEMDDVGGYGSSPTFSDTDSDAAESVKDEPTREEETLETRVTECPWCGDLVSETSLKEYSKGKWLNVQMQKRFCDKHKRETAMETWRERGYPHVDWERLEGRFGDHRAYLSRVIDGRKSHFRDILAERIETGQGRSLKKEGNLNPGYYGPRGCKLMCDYLVEEFGERLMEKAVSDHVIAGRGSAAFIQSVLVAELAVQLIMEDMDVSAAEAREIMEESKAVGEMIHEEV